MRLSVIICTHNPGLDYLRLTLEALKAQTLDQEQWELLLIDNASHERLEKTWDLSWHPHARHIREDELGLTPARVRSIRESKTGLLVFVDDDNVLAPDYLELVLSIHKGHPHIGAFGAGRIVGEFAATVPKEVTPFLAMLALRNDRIPIIANTLNFNRSIPYGAGQCILRPVALAYVAAIDSDDVGRKSLDRCGASLSSCGDVDLALFACKYGLFTGVFPELVVTHLIPARRLEPQYLTTLAEGHTASHLFLARIWGYDSTKRKNIVSVWFRHLRKLIKLKGLARQIYLAQRRGEKLAHVRLAAIPKTKQGGLGCK